MSDVERSFLSKALQAGKLTDVINRGIEPDHFADPDLGDIYSFAIDFWREHSAPPSLRIVRDEFPKFHPDVSKDPFSFHTKRFVRKVKERKAIELVRDYHDALEDPDEIDDIEIRALEMARALNEVIPAPRASRLSEGEISKREYERRKKEGIIHGIYLGIPAFDNVMLGVQPHELLTIIAYMGVGKSLLMAHIAVSAYLQGKTAMYISLEMEAEAVLRRIHVMLTNVRYHALKALELDMGEKQKWEQMLERAESERHEHDIIIRDDIAHCNSDHVMANIMRYKPDMAIVDYLELMKVTRGSSGSHWERVSDSGIGLKETARLLKCPIITAAQLSREGGRGKDHVGLHNVAYQSIGKHSDVMLGLAQDEDQEAQKEMDAMLLKDRDGPKPKTTLRWDLERMDIHEMGISERFPQRRKGKSPLKEKQRRRKFEVANETKGNENPWREKLKKAA